jgi:hypothetical protein
MRKAFVAVLATCVLVGTAAAQEPQGDQPQPSQPSQPGGAQQGQQGKQGKQGQPMEVMAERMSMTATVDKVDTKKRHVMLTDDQGNKFKVAVPKQAMKNMESLKPGDKITADYYSSVALKLQKGEKGAPGAEETTMMERKAAKLPGGLMAKKVSATVEVEKVDTSANTITVKSPMGESDTIKVTDPELQSKLANIKPGDRIQASYAEAIAVRVTPSSKQQSSSEQQPGQSPPSGQQSRR